MTPRQKTVLAVMATANILVILTAVVLVTRLPQNPPSPLPTPSQAATYQTPLTSTGISRTEGPTVSPLATPKTDLRNNCQREAVQHMSQVGLAGIVMFNPQGSLHLEIVHTLSPGETADDAAQLVWTAFDVILALDTECRTIPYAQVTILAQGDQTEVQIDAGVAITDLTAFAAGDLDEEALIDRVTYTVTAR